MSSGALKLAERHRRAERLVIICFVAFILCVAGTLFIFVALASGGGGPGAMFDGWIIAPVGIGAAISTLAATAFLSSLVDLWSYRRYLRKHHPEILARIMESNRSAA